MNTSDALDFLTWTMVILFATACLVILAAGVASLFVEEVCTDNKPHSWGPWKDWISGQSRHCTKCNKRQTRNG